MFCILIASADWSLPPLSPDLRLPPNTATLQRRLPPSADDEHYPLSDPAGTQQPLVNSNSALSSDHPVGKENHLVDSVDLCADSGGDDGGVDSGRCAQPPHCNNISSSSTVVDRHPFAQSHQGGGWSDSAVCHSTGSSPGRFGGARQLQSLPSSPVTAWSHSPANTGCAAFPIPAIPGVNMNALEHVSNVTSNSPNSSSSTVGVSNSSAGYRMTADSGGVGGANRSNSLLLNHQEGRSPSPNLAPITAAASAYMLTDQNHQKSSTPCNPTAAQDMPHRSSSQMSEPSGCSSLNKGLNFLLTTDPSKMDEEEEAEEERCVVQSSSSTDSSRRPQVSPTMDCTTGGGVGEQTSLKRSYKNVTGSDLAGVLDQVNSFHKGEHKHSTDHLSSPTSNGSAAAPSTDGSSGGNSKRIKCEPTTPTTTQTNHVSWLVNNEQTKNHQSDGTMTAVKQDDAPMNDLQQQQLHANMNAALSPSACNSILPGKSANHTLPPIPTEYDEEMVSFDLVHSISSKIDGMDSFLDESYLKFLRSFPCT